MTQRKHFKQLVRTRMEKTGERYAAARRHVIGSRGGAAAPYPHHFPGNIPATTALRSVVTAAGIVDPATGRPFSEQMLFGLSGAVGIGVFSFLYEKDDFASFFLGGRHLWQDDEAYLSAAFARLGIDIEVFETGSSKLAAKALADIVASKRPAVAWVDSGLLPHRARPEAMQGGGYHVVAVLDVINDGRTVVIGDLADEPIEIDAKDFAAARSRVKKFKNRLMAVTKPPATIDVATAIGDALTACHAGLLGAGAIGARRHYTLDALTDWADQITGTNKKSWRHVFPRGKRMWAALTMLYEFVELYGTGGGLCRPIFAAYLAETAERFNRPKLAKMGDGYAIAGRGWSELASTALPSNIAILEEARDCLTERAEIRVSEPRNRAALDRLTAELAKLELSAAKDFPMTDQGYSAQLDDLREQVLGLHEAEASLRDSLRGQVAC